jgi:AhpD family alkylhydroperoxidase
MAFRAFRPFLRTQGLYKPSTSCNVFRPPIALRFSAMRGMSSSASKLHSKKTWNLQTCLADHKDVFMSLPKILDAYAGPNAIEPQLNESIMVAVNSVNECPYCEGLHGQLARMAGVEGPEALQAAKSVSEALKVVDQPAITYARVFAENNGRGSAEEAAYADIAKHYGDGKAGSIRALCWFLQWGSVGGNTVNSVVFGRFAGSPKKGSSALFEVIFTAYYGPLFGVIWVMNQGLRLMPRVPALVSAAIGVTLTFVGGSFIVPIGIVGLIA